MFWILVTGMRRRRQNSIIKFHLACDVLGRKVARELMFRLLLNVLIIRYTFLDSPRVLGVNSIWLIFVLIRTKISGSLLIQFRVFDEYLLAFDCLLVKIWIRVQTLIVTLICGWILIQVTRCFGIAWEAGLVESVKVCIAR